MAQEYYSNCHRSCESHWSENSYESSKTIIKSDELCKEKCWKKIYFWNDKRETCLSLCTTYYTIQHFESHKEIEKGYKLCNDSCYRDF